LPFTKTELAYYKEDVDNKTSEVFIKNTDDYYKDGSISGFKVQDNQTTIVAEDKHGGHDYGQDLHHTDS